MLARSPAHLMYGLIGLVALLLAAPLHAQGDAALSITAEQARTQIETTRSAMQAIAADVVDDSGEGRRRAALRNRISLYEEYLGLVAESAAIDATRAQIPARLAATQVPPATAEPDPSIAKPLSRDEFDALKNAVEAARAQLAAARAAAAETARRVDEGLPREVQELSKREAENERRSALIAQQIAAEPVEEERAAQELRLENAQLERAVIREARAAHAREAEMLQELGPVVSAELDLAEQQAERLERQFVLASQAMEGVLSAERAAADAELQVKEDAAAAASDPSERFVAEREARLARSRKNFRDGESSLVTLRTEVAEQERRLSTEKDEFAALRDLIGRAGTSGLAEERIRTTLQQAKQRRAVLERALRTGLDETMNARRDRRFEIDDALFGLRERFVEERAAVLEALLPTSRADYVARTDGLLTRLRTALREEKTVLTELIALGQQIQGVYLQRAEVLSELERFIRSRAFWLRDGRPLGPQAFAPLKSELVLLGEWIGMLGQRQTWSARSEPISTATVLIYAVVLFGLVPGALLWLRQRLRGATRRVNDRVIAEGRTPLLMMLVMLTAILGAALLPFYLVMAARFIGAANLPQSVEPVLVTTLETAGYFLFAWFLARSFFARRSIAEVQFEMPHRAANDFYRSARWLLFAYVLGFLPWILLSTPPLEFHALARIAYTVMLLLAARGALGLFSDKSAFVQYRLEQIGTGFVATHWRSLSIGISVVVVAVLVLDFAGFRYASRSIAVSLGWTLAILLALPPLYAAVAASVRRVAQRLRPAEDGGFGSADQEAETRDRADTAERVVDFLRLATIILAVVLIAGNWGIDQRAFDTLEEIHIYGVSGSGDQQEFVTAADLVRAILFVIGTFWVLRVLPGVYEFAVFPRLNVDAGVKYASLTMSRYAVFVGGLLLALAEVHLDLGRLGWLMAAVGVGLGFGLQEIVSNFVSGVILLVERPVRPGDIVTVGGITGTVQRINIRATTIMNFDRQEVVLPNRSLITTEVTNWTRGDTMNRLIIPIGVAYGTDVDMVSQLLIDIALEQPEVLKDPPPSAPFMAHGESSLDFELRVFVPSPKELLMMRDRLNKTINKEFTARGIEIPFPQRDLNLRGGEVLSSDRAAGQGGELIK